MIAFLAVHVDRVSVVVLRSVELRKIYRTLPGVVVYRSGYQNLGPAERRSLHDLYLLFAETPGVPGHRERSRFVRRLGDNVDGGEHGVAAIQSRGRSANNLDLLDQVHVYRKIVAEEQHEVEDVVGHIVAVHHHQQFAVVIARQIEAVHAYRGVRPVVAHIESAHRRQRFAERAVAILADILGRDNGHAGGCVLQRLRVQRGALYLDVHQLIERQRIQIGLVVSRAQPG